MSEISFPSSYLIVSRLLNKDLQKTPYDDQCALRIFARCDDVMKMVMEELNLLIPPYTDLQLWSNTEWLADFERNWPFR